MLSLEGQVQELQKHKSSLEAEFRSAKEVSSALSSRCEYLSERQQALESEKKDCELKLAQTSDTLSKQTETAAATQARLNGMIESLRLQIENLNQANSKLSGDANRQATTFEEEHKRLVGLLADKQKQVEAILEECRTIREDRSQKTAALAGETRLRAELESQRDLMQTRNANLTAENKQVRGFHSRKS